MTTLTTLSPATARSLIASERRQRAAPQNTASRLDEPKGEASPRVVRFAQTCTSSVYPIYPSPSGAYQPNTYCVRLGAPDFSPKQPGRSLFDFTPYSPAEYRLAHDPQACRYWPNGSVVRVELHHDEWYIHEPDPQVCSPSSSSEPSSSEPSSSEPSSSEPSSSEPSSSEPSSSGPCSGTCTWYAVRSCGVLGCACTWNGASWHYTGNTCSCGQCFYSQGRMYLILGPGQYVGQIQYLACRDPSLPLAWVHSPGSDCDAAPGACACCPPTSTPTFEFEIATTACQDDPSCNSSSSEPSSSEPSSSEPSSSEPSSSEPSSSEPSSSEPSSSEPSSSEPSSSEPSSSEPPGPTGCDCLWRWRINGQSGWANPTGWELYASECSDCCWPNGYTDCATLGPPSYNGTYEFEPGYVPCDCNT